MYTCRCIRLQRHHLIPIDSHGFLSIYIYIYKERERERERGREREREKERERERGRGRDENVFKTTRPFCYQWFRVSTRQANATKHGKINFKHMNRS